jgi:hypothetical protein
MYLRLGMGRNDRVILYYIIASLLKETQQGYYIRVGNISPLS